MWQYAKYATRLRFWNVTSAGWQVTLCDPMWHVSSRSGVATLRTAIGVTSYGALGHVPPLELGHVKKIWQFLR